MLTRKEALVYGSESLEKAGIGDANLDAWLLLEWVCKIDRISYYMDPSKELTPEQEKKYRDSIDARMERIPLQHITGEQEFMGLPFKVSPSVLIPRQDTEVLVEIALEKICTLQNQKSDVKVLDMCTGSGCIIVSLAHYSKKKEFDSGKYMGCDISAEALAIACENAELNQTEIEFVQSDLFENIHDKFDVIVSNPPYIATKEIEKLEPEVKDHDPMLALDGKDDGLYFYRLIIENARSYLNQNGWLIFEIGYDQKEAVCEWMKKCGFSDITARKDLAGLDRVVLGRYDIS